MKNGFLNFDSEQELDRPIYRIMQQQHVIDFFKRKSNGLSPVGNWKDKFENYQMNLGHQSHRHNSEFVSRERLVAQCWTSEKYSEAMWGIYAPDTKQAYLRIKSTPRKLMEAHRQLVSNVRPSHFRVGRVTYHAELELKAQYNASRAQSPTQLLFEKSLLMKRKSFSHEREIRIIHFDLMSQAGQHGLHWYKVDPHQMITQIMADPNRDRKKWLDDKQRIASETEFKGKIRRSKVYDAPDW